MPRFSRRARARRSSSIEERFAVNTETRFAVKEVVRRRKTGGGRSGFFRLDTQTGLL